MDERPGIGSTERGEGEWSSPSPDSPVEEQQVGVGKLSGLVRQAESSTRDHTLDEGSIHPVVNKQERPLSRKKRRVEEAARRSLATVRSSALEKTAADQAPQGQRLRSPPPPGEGGDRESTAQVINTGLNTPQLSYLVGDLLDLRCGIAHCVSSDGSKVPSMGRGVAQQLNDRFHCKREVAQLTPEVGNVVVTQVEEPYAQVIYHLVTKRFFYHKPDLADIAEALMNLKLSALKHQQTTVAIPRIACGRDGHCWADIEPLVQQAFQGSTIRVIVVTRWVDIPSFNRQTVSQRDVSYGEGRPDEEGEFGPRAFDPGLALPASGDETSVSVGGGRQVVSRFSKSRGPVVTLLDRDLRDDTAPLLIHVPANTLNLPGFDVRRGLLEEYPETARSIFQASKGKPPGTWGYNIEKGKLLFFVLVGRDWRDHFYEIPYTRGLAGVMSMAVRLGVNRMSVLAPSISSVRTPRQACDLFAEASAGTGLRIFIHRASCPGVRTPLQIG